jgi:hypothetical protein
MIGKIQAVREVTDIKWWLGIPFLTHEAAEREEREREEQAIREQLDDK